MNYDNRTTVMRVSLYVQLFSPQIAFFFSSSDMIFKNKSWTLDCNALELYAPATSREYIAYSMVAVGVQEAK